VRLRLLCNTNKSIPHGSDKQQRQKKQLSNSQSKRRTSDLEGVDEGDAAAADDGDAGDAGAGDAGDVEACRACSRVTRPREATGVVAAAALRDRVVVVGVEDVASGVVDDDEASSSSSSCSAALPELLVPLAASSSSSSSATDDSSACEGVSQTSSTTADSPAVLVLSLLFSSSTIELPSSVLGSSADTVASVAGVEELGVLRAMPLARRRTPPAAATELDSGLVNVDAGVSSSSPCCCSSSPGCCCCCCCCEWDAWMPFSCCAFDFFVENESTVGVTFATRVASKDESEETADGYTMLEEAVAAARLDGAAGAGVAR